MMLISLRALQYRLHFWSINVLLNLLNYIYIGTTCFNVKCFRNADKTPSWTRWLCERVTDYYESATISKAYENVITGNFTCKFSFRNISQSCIKYFRAMEKMNFFRKFRLLKKKYFSSYARSPTALKKCTSQLKWLGLFCG